MGAAAIIAAALELAKAAIDAANAAQDAKDEEHAAILARVQASRAALAGDKSDAHLAVEAALAEAQAAIDAVTAK
jgi:hypothetical protein